MSLKEEFDYYKVLKEAKFVCIKHEDLLDTKDQQVYVINTPKLF